MTAGWERFDAATGIGVRGRGPSRAEAFAQATLGVFALVVRPGDVQARERREVRAQADTPEALAAAWVGECLYVHEMEGFLACAVEVTTCSDTLVHGLLGGEPIDPDRHRAGPGLGAASAEHVAMTRRGDSWEVEVVIRV